MVQSNAGILVELDGWFGWNGSERLPWITLCSSWNESFADLFILYCNLNWIYSNCIRLGMLLFGHEQSSDLSEFKLLF